MPVPGDIERQMKAGLRRVERAYDAAANSLGRGRARMIYRQAAKQAFEPVIAGIKRATPEGPGGTREESRNPGWQERENGQARGYRFDASNRLSRIEPWIAAIEGDLASSSRR